MQPFGWLWFAGRRLRSHLGLALLSLVGITLAISLLTCIPIFSQAVSYQVLRDELTSLGRLNQRPPVAVHFAYMSSSLRPISMADVDNLQHVIADAVSDSTGLPIAQTTAQVNAFVLQMYTAADNISYGVKERTALRQVTISAMPAIADHIVVVEGESYGIAEHGGRAGVWAHEGLADATGTQVGDSYDLESYATGQVIPVYIAGIWRARDRSDPYWYDDPAKDMLASLLVEPEVYSSALSPILPEQTGMDSWYVVLDDRALTVERADRVARGLRSASRVLATKLPGLSMDYSPLEPLERYLQRRAQLDILLVAFSAPTMILLCYFLALLSVVTAYFQREETAVLTSRGANTAFLAVTLSAEQGLLLAVGVPLGILLGYALAQMIGYTQSFLTFVIRPSLAISPGGLDSRLIAAGVVLLLLSRLVPGWYAARRGIVRHQQQVSRPDSGEILPKLVLDLSLLFISAYAYQHLKQRGTVGIINWEPTGDPLRDPLLLLAPWVLILTLCMILAHLFPLLIRVIDTFSSRLRSFSGYMGLHQLARQSGQYSSVIFLAMMCLSLGGFYSSMAQSMDRWLRERINYETGADYTLKQGVVLATTGPDATTSVPPRSDAEIEGGWLLPISDYLDIPGVVAATRVGGYPATVRQTKLGSGRFMGIDRLDFPKVAFFRPDFARVPLGELMNRLAMYSNGVLVSQQFLATNSLREGQFVEMAVNIGSATPKIEFRIVGTFDYFPTMYPAREQVFVGNLDYLFDEVGGIYRHQIWLQTKPDTDTTAVATQVKAMGVYVDAAFDTRQMIMQDEASVERVGLFGVLSIGFLAATILSGMGLLVYTFASLQSRLQQISVLRAIGSGVRDVLTMMAIEYAIVVAYGVVAGVITGVVASWLFVPIFQFSAEPALAIPPLLAQIAWQKTTWIAIIFASALSVSFVAVLYQLTRLEFFQILRMGQHP
jgi:putative ABC transport system permease protein